MSHHKASINVITDSKATAGKSTSGPASLSSHLILAPSVRPSSLGIAAGGGLTTYLPCSTLFVGY